MTDEELAVLARGGDKNAEEILLQKYTALVQAVSSRFFLSGGERQDLIQEGMVGLYSAINTFNCESKSFSAYAYTCVRNAVLGAVKKSLGAKQSALNNFMPIEVCGELMPDSPEDEIIRRENRREFLQKISGVLSSLEFKSLVMYLDGATIAEISASLSKSAKSVSNALSRAKNKLHKLYSAEE